MNYLFNWTEDKFLIKSKRKFAKDILNRIRLW